MITHSLLQPQVQAATIDDAPPVWRFDHVSVSMGADHALRTLFEGVMGLETGFRPPFPFSGRWLYEGEQAVVHAIDDASLSAEAGALRFNHVAFASTQSASKVITQLQRTALQFNVARIPADNIAQIFVQLPGGFVVELDVPDDTGGPASHVYSATQGAPAAGDF